jgi:hypothetical protein
MALWIVCNVSGDGLCFARRADSTFALAAVDNDIKGRGVTGATRQDISVSWISSVRG